MLTITCIGGDLRQLYLAYILTEQQYQVYLAGFGENLCHYNSTFVQKYPSAKCITCITANEISHAIQKSHVILGPIPFTKNEKDIYCDTSIDPIGITDFLSFLTPSQYFIAGLIPDNLKMSLIRKNIHYCDYLTNHSFAQENAIATAEGAISYAIEHSSGNLHQSSCLVLGYGTCGRIIADKLQALHATVTVLGRREETKATAISYGFSYIQEDQLANCISSYDYIFNTIPSLILDANRLSKIKSECTIVDIASAPGGLDYQYVKEHELNAILYLGIPGKIAPKASAQILYEIIIHNLKERSCIYVP